MLLEALMTELERNLDMAKSTRNLLTGERDMLQGDVKQRLIVHRFHTDVWDAVVAQGTLEQLDKPEAVAACYQRLRETNELFAKFNEEGDVIIHSPLIDRDGHNYGRDHILDILQEQCERAEDVLHDAYIALDHQISRTCPECGAQFDSAGECDAHFTQEHEGNGGQGEDTDGA